MNDDSQVDEAMDEMLGDFLDESDEILGSLNENLLKLDEWVQGLSEGQETHCDDDLMNEMFRGAHSLKGLSGMLGLGNINALTHKVENVFDAARNDKLVLNRDIVDTIFNSVDKISCMVEELKSEEPDAVDCDDVLANIALILDGSDDTPAKTAEASSSAPQPVVPLSCPILDYFADVSDESEISAKYLAIFIDESECALDDISDILLEAPTDDGTESLMIQCHKIKGSAASLGLNRATKLAHYMEDLLQELLQENKPLTVEMNSALLRCADVLRAFIDTLKQGKPETIGFNDAYSGLITSRTSETAGNAVPSDVAPPAETETADEVSSEKGPTLETDGSVDAPASDVGSSIDLNDDIRLEIEGLAPSSPNSWIVQFDFENGTALPGLKASLVLGRMSDLGSVFFCNPLESDLESMADEDRVVVGLSTAHDESLLRDKLAIQGIGRLEFELIAVGEHQDEINESETTNEPIATQQIEQRVTAPEPVTTNQTSIQEQTTEPVTSRPQSENQPDPTPAVSQNQATPAATPKPQQPAAQPTNNKTNSKSKSTETSKKPTETLRVDIERLDHLMNLAGQLVINKARFSQIGEGLKRLTTSKQAAHSLSSVVGVMDRFTEDLDGDGRKQQSDMDGLRGQARQIRAELEVVRREVNHFAEARMMINDLAEAVHQLDRVTDGIQKTVMDTRMVPIGPLFRRFKRVIRDITHSNGKEIRLVIRGENTELDKRMIDELGDPLIHMIRNCADHGIESPEERESVGKPRQGTVTLDAYHRGNSILVSIQDDGKGLDPEKIRAKAVSKGLVTAADAEKLSNHQVYQLIWEPGLSTADKVSEISGRGMGMDIVRTKIEEINGTVELDSKVGVGTTISIKLPLTLAILPSLLVEIDGDVIAMPVESVSEIVRVNEEDLSSVHGVQTATVRGRVISVIHLKNLFSWNQPPKARPADLDDEEQSLVIIGSDGVEIGLIADRLFGEEDIVIKSMAENYHNVYGIAGASILGDGRVSLILDVCAVLEMAATIDLEQETNMELAQ